MSEFRNKSKPALSRARGIVCLGVIMLIVLGFSLIPGVGSLCAAGVGAVAALCPLGVLEAIAAEKLMISPLFTALACMVLAVALLGRSFCSWICPVPHISAFFHPSKKSGTHASGLESEHALAKQLPCDEGGDVLAQTAVMKPLNDREKRLLSTSCHGSCASLSPVGGKRDGVQIDSRHFVLVGALASSAVFGAPIFCLVCPVGLTIGTLAALWIAFVDHDPTWMLLVFPLVLVLELAVFRKWCHVLCPMGALMALVGIKAPIGKPRVDSAKCLRASGIDCRSCVRACPEELDPHGSNLSECTRCGLCVENCPSSAISMPFGIMQKMRSPKPEGTVPREQNAFDGNIFDEEAEHE